MKNKDIENSIKALIASNMPNFFEEYQIIIKPAGELPDINSQNINNLTQLAYFHYSKYPFPASVSSFFNPVRQLARAYKEKHLLNDLNDIYHGKNIVDFHKQFNIPLCLFEKKVSAELYNPAYDFMKTTKYNGEIWCLFELEELLSASRSLIFDIFQDIIKKHDIETQTNFFSPQQEAATAFPTME